MLLSTFNKELYEKDLKQDAYDEGVENGRENALLELLREGILTVADVAARLDISEDEVKEKLQLYK